MDEKTVFNVTVCVMGTLILVLHIAQMLLKKKRRKDENALLAFYVFTAFHFATYAAFALIKQVYTSDPYILSFYTIFFLMNNLEVFLFYRYFSSYAKIEPKTKKRTDAVNLVCFVIFAFTDVLNLFTRFYFTSVNGVYTRAKFMFFAQGYQFIVLGMSLVLALRNKELLRREKIAFSLYVLLPAVSIVVQNLMPGYAIAYATLLVALEILTFFLMAEKNIRIKEEEKMLEESKTRILMSQIQPHFVYNTLSSISTLIALDPEKAQKALDDFSDYLRANFSSLTETRLIPFEDELRHIKTYVSLEKMRFEDRLHVLYDIQSPDFLLPPLSIQPLVENAVKHGVLKKVEGGTVTLRTYEKEDAHVVEIEDDGVGFLKEEKEGNEHIGLKNVEKRIQLMCGAKMEIESEIGKGSKITIAFFKE